MIGPAGSGGALSLAALGRDRNLRFPHRPKLIDDLRVFQMPDGLGILVHAGDIPVVLRGQLVEQVFGFLTDKLDGRRDLEELEAALPDGLPVAAVTRALRVLHTKGLLLDGAPAQFENLTPHGAGDAVLNRQLLLWGRHVGDTRGAASGAQIQQRLDEASIVVVGTGLFGTATVDLLTRSGCGRVRVLAWADEDPDPTVSSARWSTVAESPYPQNHPVEITKASPAQHDRAAAVLRDWATDADLIVTATRNAPERLFQEINRISLQSVTPWLRGNVEASTIELGPYVNPATSACFACVQLRRRSTDPMAIEHELDHIERANHGPPQGLPPFGEALYGAMMGASHLVGECIRALTGLAMPALVNRVMTLFPVSGEQRINTVLRVPRCPECSRANVSLSGPTRA
jgi:bacteriocin biosynthesis cyclodehydratase domain-containing protein